MLDNHITSRRWVLAALAAGGIAAAGTASAQGTSPESKSGAYGGSTYGGSTYGAAKPTPVATPTPTETAPPPAEPYQPMAVRETEKPFYERWGLTLALGGGVEGFTHQDDTGTNTGGNWDVRVGIGTKKLIGFEASYIGSAQSIDALGLDTDAVLVGNGLQGAFRLNLITGMGLDFFGLAGVAWRHYNLSNNDFNTSDVSETDDVAEIPVGGGMQYAYEGFLFDARAEYRFTSYGDLFINNESINNDSMDRWGVQANIGYQF